jgi:hypothetical protein
MPLGLVNGRECLFHVARAAVICSWGCEESEHNHMLHRPALSGTGGRAPQMEPPLGCRIMQRTLLTTAPFGPVPFPNCATPLK